MEMNMELEDNEQYYKIITFDPIKDKCGMDDLLAREKEVEL